MALVQRFQSRAGDRRCVLVGQISFFHSSAWWHQKWKNKYKNKSGFETENVNKKYITYERRKERAAYRKDLLNWSLHLSFDEIESYYPKPSNDRRWHKKNVSSKKTNDWEAYLRYEGDWEKFCRKFTNLSDYENRARCSKVRGKKLYHEWVSESEEEDDDDDDDDDGWDDDPTFGARFQKTRRPKVAPRTAPPPKPVITIGLRTDRVALGLPPVGSLTMEELKTAFRAAALKWHPDRHQGSSKDSAEEKFKACGNAYRALCSALAESNNRC